MKLANLFSLSSGAKLDKPYIYQQFFPIDAEKYVVFSTGGGNGNFPAKLYDFYKDVLDWLYPILKENSYQTVQIGKNDAPLPNIDINLINQTSISQTSFIINNASCVICNDTFISHMAGGLNVPLIALYGATSYPHQPFWKNQKTFLLESHRFNKSPSFTSFEQEKTINLIKPEEVIKSCLDILEINSLLNINSIVINPNYLLSEVNLVPDCVMSPDFYQGVIPNLRMDYLHDEQTMFNNLTIRPYILWLNNKIDNMAILEQLKSHVAAINYFINSSEDIKFAKKILELGIKLALHTELPEDDLNKIKLDLLDLPLVNQIEPFCKQNLFENTAKYNNINIEEAEKMFFHKNTKYKSNNIILSNNKVFLSKDSWENNISAEPKNNFWQDNFNIENPDLIKESDRFYIYTE